MGDRLPINVFDALVSLAYNIGKRGEHCERRFFLEEQVRGLL